MPALRINKRSFSNEANLAPILNSFKIALSMAENKKKLS